MNGYIKLFFDDTVNPTEIKDGDVIDEDRKILLKIYPDSGYYVDGSDVKNDIYQKSMTYAKYLKNVKKILEDHQIKEKS